MKPDRSFYVTAGAIFLLITAIGFGHYIFGGTRPDGSPINPAILALVVLHSSAIFARWVAHISLVLGNVGFLVGC